MKLTIQFVTDERILIRGTGGVSVRGQILNIGPGEVGARFDYHSPEEQKEMFGRQNWVLIAAEDDDGSPIRHPDLGRSIDGPAFIDPALAANWPSGVHDFMREQGAIGEDVPMDASEDEEYERPKSKIATATTITKGRTKITLKKTKGK